MEYQVLSQRLFKKSIFILGYLVLASEKAIASPQPSSPKSVTQILPPLQSIPENIILSRFEIIGNRVIPDEEIDRVLKPYLFRPISFSDLLEVQQIITQLYVEKGYLTSGAFIPPQSITNRTIKIEIVEGTIGEIKILGLKKLRPEYIRRRIAIASQPPVNQKKLLEALQLLQLNPLIKNISAELSQGIKPGESFLKLKIEEADSFDVTLDLNNDITTSVGSLRGRVSIEDRNFFGFGDRLRIGYSKSEGSESLERLEYTAPIGARGTSLRLFHNRSENQIILDPFPILDLESEGVAYGATLIQKLINKPAQNAIIAFAFNHYNTQFTIQDTGFFDLARGLDRDGRSVISSLRFIQEYSDRSENRVFAIGSQFALGIDAFGSTINNDSSPDSKFLLWKGQARYLRAISSKTNLSLQGTMQIADRSLFAQEQFLAGGVKSVRGYSRGIIQADNGFSFSTELNHTILKVPQWNLSLELAPFFDFARIWNADNLPLETNNLASVGIASKLAIDDNFIFNLAIGIPLIDAKLPEGNSLEDNGVHFSLTVKPF